MADGGPNLNLTPEEKRVFYQLFQAADTTNLGVVTGEVAVSFFEKTNLPPDTLGLIWQIADTQNRGLLTPSGFGVVLRLIGHAQAGRPPTEELSLQPGPLPKFVGLSDSLAARVAEARTATTSPPPPTPTSSGGPGPVRVPPLNPDDINKFASLFDKSDVQNGLLSGETAKQIFERARLPNEVLGRIWNLSDTKQRGALDGTEFIIAMHLLTSYKTGALRGLPQTLPQGLYDVAARRGSVRTSTGSRASDVPPVPAIPKQFSGSGPQRTQSPITRPPQYGSPLSAQSTGGDWLVTPQEKAHFDTIFATVDKAGFGQINGEQAVTFFTNAQLPEETLAQIWDLADIDSDGQLSKEEFAVAMYLVRQQRSKKEPLPQVLPPALIPPSMRRQNAAAPPRPAQPPPAAAPAPTAADDLFGLDSFTTPSQQVPQSTGGSNGPFQPASPTSRASPPGASSTFKPFIPSSSFGQSLTPQVTGAAPSSPNRAPPQPSDDLLGDNDPEESKKLTKETTELGNLSNQISSLSKEMQNVQEKRASTEQEVAQNNQQKRDFEARLAQARTMYDQEVKNFKTLEERLATSRAETKKLQQEFALIDGSRQDLQNQFNQASAALESDQRENASLKERIRQANAEVAQLKPQLEKVRSEARQHKGLVAINKKQLATVEGERDRLNDDIDAASKGTNEADENVTPPAAAVSSPAASVASQNTNPFFRRTATGSTDNALTSPDSTREKPSDVQSAFDSFFGPSMTTPSASGPPPTSFRSESYDSASQGLKGSESSNPTPSTSPPPVAKEPPPPPQSRQITPSILPLRENSQQSISTTSSIKVSPPASRFGAPTGGSEVEASAPSTSAASLASTEQGKGDSASNGPQESAPANNADANSLDSDSDSSTQAKTLPGAFPEPPAPMDTGKDGQGDVSFDELFGGVARQRSSSQKAMDFEEAMASMGRKTDAPKTNGDATQAKSSEFPPIQEIGDDDDDDDSTDSEAPMGFDDDFTAASPPRNTGTTSQPKETSSEDQQMRAFPPIESTSNTPLPAADSQASPPSYDKGSAKDEPADFPREFNGLLPNRGDPTSPPDAPHSKEHTTGDPIIGGVPQHGAVAGESGKKAVPADFEAAFAGLDLAPAEADEDDDDDPFESNNNKFSTDFDMSFDTPVAHAKSTDATPGAAPSNDPSANVFDFDSNASKPAAATSHDWDALFSGLDESKKTENGDSDGKASAETPGTSRPPGWALGVDTGEDDLILQRLTSMGYPRDESLAALEKFDYNIDKAADFLTSKT
ncbi:hypothetical protein FQN54_007712 [Arachnomyces sp. PD_36]|nr:hypothetical protein FQN54_007712 [Arachnomyces sp. PD_36]